MNPNINTKKIVITAILSTLALIMFMVESLFPPIFVPGAKMGLSNIIVLWVLLMFGETEALFVLLVKCILGSLLTGNPSAMLYSIPAGLISLLVEILLIKHVYPKVSVVAVSVAASVINSVIQNVMHSIISGSFSMMAYSPYLVLVSIISGFIVGAAVYLLVKYLPDRIIAEFKDDSEYEEE